MTLAARAILALLAGVLTACVPHPSRAGAATSILDSLPGTGFPIDLVDSGVARLVHGRFAEPAAPGGAGVVEVTLGAQRAEGDLDGDGVPDAAAILVASGGGTGNFRYLAAALNRAGAPRAVPAVLVGDRVLITGLAIEAGTIVVRFLDHAPGQALADSPSVRAVRRFRVEGDALVEAR